MVDELHSPVTQFRHLDDMDPSGKAVGKAIVVKPGDVHGYGDGADAASADLFINYPHRPYPESGEPGVGVRIEVFSDGEHNAFGGVALVGSELVAVWRRASQHGVVTGTNRGRLMLSRSPDLGRTWPAPTVAVDDDPDDARDASLTLLSDGRLALTYMTNDGSSPSAWVRFSSDHGVTWSDRVSLMDGWSAVSAPLVELDDGTLLSPVGTSTGGNQRTVWVVFSTDGGTSFGGAVEVASSTPQWVELNVSLLEDGTLLGLVRDNTNQEVHVTTSSDGGATWSALTKAFDGFGRPSHVQFSSGTIVCLYRTKGGGEVLGLRVSHDGGSTWSTETVVDDDNRQAYAQLVEVSGGQVAAVYALEAPGGSSSSEADVFFRYLIDGEGITAVGDDTLTVAGSSVTLSDDDPLADGTADAGTSGEVSRSDHVHPATASPSGSDRHRLVVLVDDGAGGVEPLTDDDGLWLYGAYPGTAY